MNLSTQEELTLSDLLREGGRAKVVKNGTRLDYMTCGLGQVSLDSYAITRLANKGFVASSGLFVCALRDLNGDRYDVPMSSLSVLKEKSRPVKEDTGWIG